MIVDTWAGHIVSSLHRVQLRYGSLNNSSNIRSCIFSNVESVRATFHALHFFIGPSLFQVLSHCLVRHFHVLHFPVVYFQRPPSLLYTISKNGKLWLNGKNFVTLVRARRFWQRYGSDHSILIHEFDELWAGGPAIPCSDMHQSFTDALVLYYWPPSHVGLMKLVGFLCGTSDNNLRNMKLGGHTYIAPCVCAIIGYGALQWRS